MPIALVDKYTKEELQQIVSKSFCMRELLSNIGYRTTSGRQDAVVKKRLIRYGIDTGHFTHGPQKVHTMEDIFCLDSTASQATLRRWYQKLYLPQSCSLCGQNTNWNGKYLSLTLDHINGINKDNRLENLRWICPNCDRQLGTFAGKNTKRS